MDFGLPLLAGNYSNLRKLIELAATCEMWVIDMPEESIKGFIGMLPCLIISFCNFKFQYCQGFLHVVVLSVIALSISSLYG